MRLRPALWGIGLVVLVCASASAAATARPTPAGVVWGGARFTDPVKLTAWLGRRGVRYQAWARRHPHGVYLLTHPAPVKRSPSPPAPPPVLPVESPSAHGSPVIVAALLVIAAGMLLFGAGGGVLAPALGTRFGVTDLSSVRVAAAAGGLTIVVGAALVWWL